MLRRVAETTKPSVPPSNRHARRLRTIGIAVLATGLVAAGIVYWLGTRGPDLSNQLSMQGFNRAQRQQMGQLYGKSGQLIDELSGDLEQPGTQAGLIAGFSVVVLTGCFYFARLLDGDEAA